LSPPVCDGKAPTERGEAAARRDSEVPDDGKEIPVMSGDGPKPRADAVRNRAKVLEAAERVFTAKGASASTEEIARVAGVGVGTVFRHFPTKEDLLKAVFVGRMKGLADIAQTLGHTADPARALSDFIRRAVDQSDAKNAFAGMLAAAGVDVTDATAPARGDLRAALAVLLAGAQKAGAARAELTVEDVIALLAGASRAAEYAGADDRSRERVLSVILAGVRPMATPH
jgi:AcrR family transcriptional regulator